MALRGFGLLPPFKLMIKKIGMLPLTLKEYKDIETLKMFHIIPSKQ